jgi:hypothetical protein
VHPVDNCDQSDSLTRKREYQIIVASYALFPATKAPKKAARRRNFGRLNARTAPDEINAADVLVEIRDGRAKDLNGLVKIFAETSGNSLLYLRNDVFNVLQELKSAGLVKLQSSVSRKKALPRRDDHKISNVSVRLIPTWHRIQRCLGFSLADLAEKSSDTIEVAPHFGTPIKTHTVPDVFVLAPFKPKFRQMFVRHIMPVAGRLGLAAMRGDDFFTATNIVSDIWRAIYFAQVIIADCSERNPNVFYEIGLAHTLGRPVILITENIDDVPFDLRQMRFIDYSYTPRGMKTFQSRLASAIRSELGM